MKNIYIITLVSIGLCASEVSQLNLYDVPSGKIDYKISGSVNMMGMGSMQTSGKKRLIFKDNGKVSLEESVKVEKQNIMGQVQKTKTHTMNYRNGVVNYVVDFSQKRIDRMVNPMAMLAFGNDKKSVSHMIEENLKKMGAKKEGKGKVLGYECDIWNIMGVKQCLYKGIPLKIESNIAGMKQVEVATKINFSSVDDSAFKLPDFPIYSGSMEAMMNGIAPKQIDKSKLKQMDKQANAEAKQGANDLSQAIDAGLEGAKSAGYDPKSGDELTPSQEKAMQEAIINSMNTNGAFKEMKTEMLQGAKPRVLDALKDCYENASNLKSANRCVDEFSPKLGGEMEYFDSWDSVSKTEAIQEIDRYKKAIPCIKSAKSMQVLMGCME